MILVTRARTDLTPFDSNLSLDTLSALAKDWQIHVKEKTTMVHDTAIDIGLCISTEFLTVDFQVVTACKIQL